MKRTAELARDGDKEAFIRLIDGCKQDLYKVARGYFRNDEIVADAIQDTIVACYEQIHTLRRPEYFKTWLIRILINKCNELKRAPGTVGLESAPEKGYEDSEPANVEFNMVMSQLDEQYRVVLILHYAEDLSVQQISDALGISVDAVKARLKRGRAKAKVLYIKSGAEAAI